MTLATTTRSAVLGSGILIAQLLGGCAGPRMVPPADVTKVSQAYEAQDRSRASGLLADESFDIGPYHVDDVDRDATSKSSFSVGGYGNSSTTTGYTYKVTANSKSLEGACGSLAKSQGFSMGGDSAVNWGSVEITCTCDAGGSGSEVKLKGANDTSTGSLTLGDASYDVTAVTETEGSNFSSNIPGFRVDGDGAPAGAVETLYPGKIWIDKGKSEEESDQLSCLFVGLMLYVPPSNN